MTAPTIAAPAPAVPAAAPVSQAPVPPAVPAAPTGPKRAGDMLKLSDGALMQTLGLNPVAETEAPALPPIDAVPAVPETPEPAPAEVPAEKAPEAPETPATDVAPRVLATQFKVFDKDGELAIPEMEIVYPANGKERRDPLDKVVRLAQLGVYNEEREQGVKEIRAQHATMTAEYDQMKAYMQALQQDVQALFSDPTGKMYENYKNAYAAQHTPEARAERAERALAAERQKGVTQETTQQANAFAGALDQYLTDLTTKHPEVSFHEILGRFSELTLPYMQAGRVPPQAFPVVAQLVEQELTPWVQHHHQTRTDAKASVQRDADAKIQRERQAATTTRILAKRQVARAVPGSAGTTPTPIRETPQAPKYKKADDILGDVSRLVQASG